MREPEKPYYLTREEIDAMLRDVRAKLAQASAAWDREHRPGKNTETHRK